MILTNPAHLKRKDILKDIFNTVEEINKINMEEALEDKNQDDADDEDEDGEDVFYCMIWHLWDTNQPVLYIIQCFWEICRRKSV